MAKLMIFKYPVPLDGVAEIQMHKGATVLTVQAQGGIPCIWAIVDPDAEMEIRRFRLFGTGHPLDIDLPQYRYIGTFQLAGGGFIGHLFE